MALVVVSGFPCSGKTTRALQIKQMLESKIAEAGGDLATRNVVVINDELLGVSRSAYDGELLGQAWVVVVLDGVVSDGHFQDHRKQDGEGGPGKSSIIHHS
jgi:tRNA uridine 5-carbamoylmethylation protein Kti12